MPIRLAINGALGRMGRAAVRLALEDPAFKLAAAIEAPGSPALDRDYGTLLGREPLGVPVKDALAAPVDALLDFSTPEASLARLDECARARVGVVICTTGFDEAQRRRIAVAAKKVPVVLAPNASLGIAVLLRHLSELARELGEAFDIEVVEMHHRAKRDAPSGTAISIAEELARATGRKYPDDFVFGRRGRGGERPSREIGVHALRGGGVLGEHTVVFASDDEVVTVTHRAGTRDLFARGALRAARFVAAAKPGLYSMQDVLKQS